ncbi:MAG TPA: glycosyltransferase family 4 protein [Solirubrobacteraceae bacterium]
MRVLVFHGYLLSGTGSNVYNARLAEALVRLGHDVHLFSQDRHPERQLFVDAVGDWDGGELSFKEVLRLRSAGSGRCAVYRPDIGGLLPVYVQDDYEGIEAKTFARCSRAEIDAYVEANVEAVREVAARARPDLALANHLVMGPVILARGLPGETPYAVKVHGSALEYTVKPERERFLGYAKEGLARASTVLVGSRHTAESLWEALGEVHGKAIRPRTRLGPPGVDVERFSPRDAHRAETAMRELVETLRGMVPAPAEERSSAFARSEAAAADALERVLGGSGPLTAFVGKLIVSKGVDLLIAAWPLVLRTACDARLVVAGFGAYRDALELLVARLAEGDLDGAREIARAGRSLEGHAPKAHDGATAGGGDTAPAVPGVLAADRAELAPTPPLRHLLAFLDSLSGVEEDAYRTAALALEERIVFTGRLDHEELADVLSACEALVVPSTFPEAFGMVAVEAAACGVLPVSGRHSGLVEVSEVLAAEVPEPASAWLSFPIDDNAVRAIASRVVGWLGADTELKERTRSALVSVARERWSWEGVARGVIAAARGEPVARPFG